MRFPGRNLHQGGSSQIKVRSLSWRTATCPRAQRNFQHSNVALFQSPELHHFCTKNCTIRFRLGTSIKVDQGKSRSFFSHIAQLSTQLTLNSQPVRKTAWPRLTSGGRAPPQN